MCYNPVIMDIHHLRVFVSVFRNRSFSKASVELYLSQPTISDHIKSLEEELNCRLFDRLGRTIIPTKEAEVLYGLSVEIIEKTHAIKEVLGHLKKELTGELIIGASTIPGTYLMPSIMAVFKKTHPSVTFQIVVSDSKGIIEKVLRHELFLGIVGSKLSNANLIYAPFMDDELIAVSSLRFIKNNTLTLKELLTLPLILREEGSGTRREIEKIIENRGIPSDSINIAGIFSSADAVKQSVKEGLGVSIVSRLSVKDELQHKLLKEIKVGDINMKRYFYIITHKKRTLPPAYEMFLEYIRTNMPAMQQVSSGV